MAIMRWYFSEAAKLVVIVMLGACVFGRYLTAPGTINMRFSDLSDSSSFHLSNLHLPGSLGSAPSMNEQTDTLKKAEGWFIPLSRDGITLEQAYAELSSLPNFLNQDDVPFVIKLVESPDWDLPGIDVFHGAVNLKTHDCIHLLLGRGILPKDEAFVIGFTMGSTNRVSSTEESLFAFFAKHFYPEGYQFSDEDNQVFKDACRLGYISDCEPLDKVDYSQYHDQTLAGIRSHLGIEVDLLRACYAIEKRRYPDSRESQRLLD